MFSSEKYNESLPMYEIIIGGWNNQQSSIRKCGQESWTMASNHTPLSETDFQSFWITWMSNSTQNGLTIRAGIGAVEFVNEFLLLHDSEPCNINYIGISTGDQSEGTWIFVVGKLRSSNFHDFDFKAASTVVIYNHYYLIRLHHYNGEDYCFCQYSIIIFFSLQTKSIGQT